jgi:formylglycine-generating enzyme
MLRSHLKLAPILLLLGLTSPFGGILCADIFGTGSTQFEMEFVTIGFPNNIPDQGHPAGPGPSIGTVMNTYRLAKFEVSEEMIQKANAATSASAFPLNIVIDSRGPNMPATSISWFESARFINWLNITSGYSPAYKFVNSPQNADQVFVLWEAGDIGYNPNNPFRNTLSHYFLPSADEWYKAAYFNPNSGTYSRFANSMAVPPVAVSSSNIANTAVYDQQSSDAGPAEVLFAGGPSAFGTIGQGGNVNEWHETERDLTNDTPFAARLVRGGAWYSHSLEMSTSRYSTLGPLGNYYHTGFRVASVPEPNSLPLLLGYCILARELRHAMRICARRR